MKTTTIDKLKKGDYFKRKPDSKTVHVYDGYNRHSKKYDSYKFEDVSSFISLKKGTTVYTDFDF